MIIMKKEITPEQLIKNLKEMNMTEEERLKLRAEEIGEEVGKYIAGIIVLLLAPTIIWAVLVYIIGIQVAWLKVFGGYFLFNFIKNITVRSFK